MSEFGERLRELRTEKSVTQETLAKAVGVNQSNIGNWENGVHEPKLTYIVEIARFFNVSSDYLLGLDDQRGNIVIERGDKPPKPSKETLQLIDLISKLSPIDQANAVGYIKGLQSKK